MFTDLFEVEGQKLSRQNNVTESITQLIQLTKTGKPNPSHATLILTKSTYCFALGFFSLLCLKGILFLLYFIK